ncbi:hypothetical protein B0H13DRAFT_1903034 [Mycena leptocephala]|nr:hypothetical protein B0H13DRAFT_1903034 [Mycena leptocephala]
MIQSNIQNNHTVRYKASLYFRNTGVDRYGFSFRAINHGKHITIVIIQWIQSLGFDPDEREAKKVTGKHWKIANVLLIELLGRKCKSLGDGDTPNKEPRERNARYRRTVVVHPYFPPLASAGMDGCPPHVGRRLRRGLVQPRAGLLLAADIYSSIDEFTLGRTAAGEFVSELLALYCESREAVVRLAPEGPDIVYVTRVKQCHLFPNDILIQNWLRERAEALRNGRNGSLVEISWSRQALMTGLQIGLYLKKSSLVFERHRNKPGPFRTCAAVGAGRALQTRARLEKRTILMLGVQHTPRAHVLLLELGSTTHSETPGDTVPLRECAGKAILPELNHAGHRNRGGQCCVRLIASKGARLFPREKSSVEGSRLGQAVHLWTSVEACMEAFTHLKVLMGCSLRFPSGVASKSQNYVPNVMDPKVAPSKSRPSQGRLELSNASVCADASLERGQCAALCMRGGKLELIGLLLEWGANPECRG